MAIIQHKSKELDTLVNENQIISYVYEQMTREDGDCEKLIITLPSGDFISIYSNGPDGSYLSVDVY